MSNLAYQYVVLRCVPRVDREEFVNVGVVVYCESAGYLDVSWHVDRDRLEDALVAAGHDDHPLRRRIELLGNVGLDLLDIRAQAVEGHASRAVAHNQFVQLAADLLP